jgi:pimeloyl-ACP methyl ester carboxylesterase/DNA-binding CsgD family transcriptional regulator
MWWCGFAVETFSEGGVSGLWQVRSRVGDHVSVARRVPPTCYAQSAGAKIAYQVSGDGACDLVLVPGLVSHLELQWQQLSYRRFVTALEHACRVIRFDKRGTGLSDPTDALPSMDERVVDLAAVMDAAGSQAAVVLGISDGGRGAIAFAAAHPGRVLGLILYGTSYRGPRTHLLRRYRAIVDHWGEGNLLELVAPSLVGPVSRDAAGAYERAAASPGMAAALIESMARADVRGLLPSLHMPVLVVHREDDMIPLGDARAVADAIPGAVLTIVPGRDHLPWAGAWEPVVHSVAEFVTSIAAPPSVPAKGLRPSAARQHHLGWPALTEGEWRVASLAIQGHTNAEIADRLFLSRYTVETHLKHIFAKLGLRSRAELAAVAGEGRGRSPNT